MRIICETNILKQITEQIYERFYSIIVSNFNFMKTYFSRSWLIKIVDYFKFHWNYSAMKMQSAYNGSKLVKKGVITIKKRSPKMLKIF